MAADFDTRVRGLADDRREALVRWRRDLHRHPELGFEEHRTAAIVESHLRELDLEVHTGIAGTGLIGVLRPAGSDEPAVLLRADMDALPIQEVSGRDYGSTIEGRMHACGHDGHTAMLLGAAEVLCEMRDALSRPVVFCFQPAEEGLGGGRRMVEEGVLDIVPVGAVYGLHLWSLEPAGRILVRPGAFMAAVDSFQARIVGRGGHGALPHESRDPIVAAAQCVTALQTIVSRTIDPVQPAVVTVGELHAGTATNIIPDDARMTGTLRSFDDRVRQTLRTRVRELLEATAAGAGCRAEVTIHEGYPAVINSTEAARIAREAATMTVGEDSVSEPPPIAASEDFSYFLRERPGAFLFLGAGNEELGITAPHHSPEFDIDESVLPRGSEMLARLALHAECPR
ncbi:MAG: amidohydrolase [bacterium]|nr:amidohydrolase [bacterium]